MANLPGIDISHYDRDRGSTTGTKIAELVQKGVLCILAKVGQAYFLDGAWTFHKARLLEHPDIQRGAYWYIQRDPSQRHDWFYPPVHDGWTYRTSTHGFLSGVSGYSSHRAYDVDFNRVVDGSDVDDEGDPVRAIQRGTVSIPSNIVADGGVYIIHPGGYRSRYIHMRSITVNDGDTVTIGQRIGSISNKSSLTSSFGPHLHHTQERRPSSSEPYARIPVTFRGQSLWDGPAWAQPWELALDRRVDGPKVTGQEAPTAYSGVSQARQFVAALGGNPAGWLCALDVEGAASDYGQPPDWQVIKQFADEFWRLAPGYPLWIYTRKLYWNAKVVTSTGIPADAKAYGFRALWTADYTQGVTGVYMPSFATKTAPLQFDGGSDAPYSGNYAGFQTSTILQYGPLNVNGDRFDGDAIPVTFATLRQLATGVSAPAPLTVPDVLDEEEAQALDILTGAGLVPGTRSTANSGTIEDGRVISTTPAAGTVVAAGARIAYVVSLGPATLPGGTDPFATSPCEGA